MRSKKEGEYSMKNQTKYFLIGIITLLLSTPLGYFAVNTIYASQNLSSEYDVILNGFIHSFMLVGVLVFIIGLVNLFVEKSIKK